MAISKIANNTNHREVSEYSHLTVRQLDLLMINLSRKIEIYLYTQLQNNEQLMKTTNGQINSNNFTNRHMEFVIKILADNRH